MSSATATFSVHSSSGSYPVHIGFGLLSQSSLFSTFVQGKRVCIVSNLVVAEHYLEKCKTACISAGATEVKTVLIAEGENSKTLSTAENIWTFLIDHHFDRQSVLIALGGGVVGDIAGFCAACYLRGISIIHCPTSLLAQIDSAIGGKTAINYSLGKNLIGAFHAPKAVVIDILTLDTLPEAELKAAIGELIKYAVIADQDFFEWLEDNLHYILERKQTFICHAITRACELKAKIVSQDEKDTAIRAILNFGHTVGHAVESLSGYRWRHGEAVCIGMLVATHLSWQQGWIEKKILERVAALINRLNLPQKDLRGITVSLILAKMKQDKKHLHEELHWILLRQLGKACSGNVLKPEQIIRALVFCGAEE